jgi:hypothetical protein
LFKVKLNTSDPSAEASEIVAAVAASLFVAEAVPEAIVKFSSASIMLSWLCTDIVPEGICSTLTRTFVIRTTAPLVKTKGISNVFIRRVCSKVKITYINPLRPHQRRCHSSCIIIYTFL